MLANYCFMTTVFNPRTKVPNDGGLTDPGWGTINSHFFMHTNVAIWHEMDNAASVDVGVDEER